ncbi:hypothetical protein [Oryzobacter terrae]|uniref:hypothetical protein n=1 Tax=Oryzobacter terrae TaxID=1620385 RepID=UPI00367288BB
MTEPIERPFPGAQYTVMTAVGDPTGGLLPVVGVTFTEDGSDEWTGAFVLLDDQESIDE